MSRYAAAGINPNLVAGSGGAGNAVTLPKYNAPTTQFNYKPAVDPLGMLTSYQDMAVKQAQIDLLKSQKSNTDARTATEALRPDQIEQLLRLSKGKFDIEKGKWGFEQQMQEGKLDLQGVSRLMQRQQFAKEGWKTQEAQAKAWDTWSAYNARSNTDYYGKKFKFETSMMPKQLERYGLQTQIATTQQLMDKWWYDYYNRFNAGSTRIWDKVSEGLGTITGFASGLKGLTKKNTYNKTYNKNFY
jgi:hypothetical protein